MWRYRSYLTYGDDVQRGIDHLKVFIVRRQPVECFSTVYTLHFHRLLYESSDISDSYQRLNRHKYRINAFLHVKISVAHND